jgi:O-Antigen ligase
VSSAVTAPGGAPSVSTPTTTPDRRWLTTPTGDFLVGASLALALVLISFLASGGIDLAPNTWVQVALFVLGAASAIAAVVYGARGRAWGLGALLLFGALAALTYASIGWSVQPAQSWLEANRTLSYLAAFAIALMAARIMPTRWRGLLGGLAVATTVVSGYALLVKVFPATFDPLDTFGRLLQPLGYWNAVGLFAALGIPACLWAGARRDPAPLLRAVSVPAIAILVATLVLSYSRGALAAAVIGTAFWFACVPLRLRGALVLLLGLAGGGAIAAWALATHGISADNVALPARTSAGHAFGLVLIVVLLLTAVAGVGGVFALDRFTLSADLRRRIGTALVGLVALVPVAGIGALAASSRGFTGEVSHIWNTLTNPNGGLNVNDKPGRLVDLSNSRPHYWSVALKIGEHHLLAGVGALGFATAQSQYPAPTSNPDHEFVGHAHGYLFQTFADFGLVGVVLSLGLLLAWTFASVRPLGLAWLGRGPHAPRPPPESPWSAERSGMLTLFAVVLTFGVHSLIDWTWFIPATAIAGLICAGWLAGRGPLAAPVGRRERRRAPSRTPSAAITVASVVVIAVAGVWVTVQPLRSADAYAAAQTAAIGGDAATALTDARSSAAEDPVSIDPLTLMSQIYTALRNQAAARRELVDAVSRQPSNPTTWEQLGCYDLGQHRTSPAATEFRRALILAPGQTQMQSDPTAFCASLTP